MGILSQKKTIILLGFLILVNLILFNLPGLPFGISSATANAPNMQIPDLMFSYSADYVFDFLTAIEPAGRASYQLTHLTIDLSFPLLFSLFFVAVMNRFVSLLGWPSKHLPYIGLFSGVFDLAENFTLLYITDRYPQFFPNLSQLAQIFTLGKFLFIAVNLILSVYLAVRVIRQRAHLV